MNYYGVVGNKIVKLTKPEDALKLMDDKYDAINEFLKKEKIKFKKQSELINLFNYFNQLNK